jgi:hypothetical protein
MVSLRRTDYTEVFNATISKPTVSKGYLHFKAPKDLTLNQFILQIFDKNAVVSGSLTVDVKTATTADDLLMTSVFSVVPTIDFSSASDYTTSNGTLSTTTIAAGSYLRLDITSIPSGWTGNLQILLKAS